MIGTTSGTALNKIWKDVGALEDDLEIIQADKMYTSELNGEKITLWKDLERTEKELLALSPEDESRSISENCTWGIRRRFEQGKIIEGQQGQQRDVLFVGIFSLVWL
jgi:hypothetical protein